MSFARRLLALAFALPPASALAGDYLGTLRLPKTPDAAEVYSFSTLPAAGVARSDEPLRLKLGYKYSRYLSVEGEFNDLARLPSDSFAISSPSLVSPFRAAGFGVDTVATVPFWGFSFYGRLGAYRGDPGLPFATYSTSLLGDAAARTHLRYGLGVRYDITSSLGIRAQVERYSQMGSPLSSEGGDGDLFSVGLSWRF